MARRTKTKKKINSKLLMILLVIAVPVLMIMAIAIDSRRPFLPNAVHKLLGRDPEVLLAKAEAELPELERYYNELKSQANEQADPEEAAKVWETLLKDEYTIRAREVYQGINDAKRFSKGNLELQVKALKAFVRFHKITDNYYKGVLGNWKEIVRLDINNYDTWKKLGEFYLDVTDIYVKSENLVELDSVVESLKDIRPEEAYGHALELMTLSYRLNSALSEDVLSDKEKGEAISYDLQQKFPDSIVAAKACAMFNSYLVQEASGLVRKQGILEKSAKILRAAIESNPESPEAYLNYFKYYFEGSRSALQAELKASVQQDKAYINQQMAEFNLSALQEFNLAELKFSDNADIKVAKANFLSVMPDADFGEIRKLYEEAVAKEPDNLIWYSVLGKLCYLSGDESNDVATLKQARAYLRKTYYGYSEQSLLSLEGGKVNAVRYAEVMPFLALVDSVLYDEVEEAKAELNNICVELSEDKGATSSLTISCEGLQAMAKGQEQLAIQRLYAAVTSESTSEYSALFMAELRWKLYELLKDGQYKMEALQNAVLSYSMRNRSAEDFSSIIDTYLSVRTAKSKQEVVQLIDMFSRKYERDSVYYPIIRTQLAQAYVALGEQDKAEEVIADIKGNNLDLRILRSMTLEDPAEQIKAMEAIAVDYPAEPKVINYLYARYMAGMKEHPSYHDKLKKMMARAVEAKPDDYYYIQEKLKAEEPDPLAIDPDRMLVLQQEAIAKLSDPYEQAMTSGRLYSVLAVGESKEQALQDNLKAIENFEKAAELKPDSSDPLTAILTTYLTVKDFAKAESVVARLKEVDAYLAKYAEIDLLFAKEEYQEADQKLTEYLAESPLSADGHLVHSKVYTKLGRKADAMRELETSLSQNRFNADAIVDYLIMLHGDFVAVGLDNVGPAKIQTMMGWIEQLMNISPNNLQGVRFFVQYAPYWARILDGQLDSPNIEAQTAEAYKQTIADIEVMLLKNINVLLASVSGNDSLYVVSANSLRLMSNLSVLSNKTSEYNEAIEKIYQSGIKAMPESAVIASSYEMFLRNSGQGDGKGLEMLKEMLVNSTGKEHFDTVMALARFYYSDGDVDSAIELLGKEVPQVEDLDLRKDMRTLLASIYKSTGKYDKAMEVYQQQRDEKDSDELMTLHIESMMDGGYTEQAKPLLEKMESQYPDDYKVYLLKAKYALRETDYEQAITYADQALKLSPSERVGLQIKAQAQFYSDDLYAAMQTINELRTASSEDSNDGRGMLAQIYSRLKKYDDAIIELRKGLEIQPGDMQLNNMMVNTLTNLKRWNELVGYYKNQIKVYPGRYELYSSCAQAMMKWADSLRSEGNNSLADQKLTDALSLLESAILSANEKGATAPVLVDTRLELLINAGHYDDVVRSLDKNPDILKASPQLQLRKMEALYLQEKKQEALGVLSQVIDMVAKDPYIEFVVEKTVTLIDPELLADWVDTQLETSDSKMALYMLKAVCCRDLGDNECYVANSVKAHDFAGGSESLEFVTNSRLAIAYIQTDKYDSAIVIYRKLCDQVPDNYSLLNNYAYALLSEGGYAKEALDVAIRAYQIARLEPMVLDTYGMALLQNDNPEKAHTLFSKAIQEIQRNNREVPVEFEYHLGQSLVKAGRTDEASEMLEDLLRRARLSQSPSDLKMVDDVEKLLDEIKK